MRIKGGGMVLALGLAVGLAVAPAEAQRGPGFRGQAAGPFAGQSLNVLLENQEAIGLNGDQVAQLNEMKVIMDREVTPLAEEMRAIRDQIRAGDLDRAEGFRKLEDVRGKMISAAAPLRGRVQEILTVQQHRRLQGMVWQNRPGAGRGGPPAAGRGGRFAPGRGGGWQGRSRGFRGAAGRGAFGFNRGQRGFPGPRDGRLGPAFRRGGGIGPWFAPGLEPAQPRPGGDVEGRGQGFGGGS